MLGKWALARPCVATIVTYRSRPWSKDAWESLEGGEDNIIGLRECCRVRNREGKRTKEERKRVKTE